jgi:hypothetical protein
MNIQNIKIPFDAFGNLIWRKTYYSERMHIEEKQNYVFEDFLTFVRYVHNNSGLGFLFKDSNNHSYYMGSAQFERLLLTKSLINGVTDFLPWTFKKTGAVSSIMLYEEESDI